MASKQRGAGKVARGKKAASRRARDRRSPARGADTALRGPRVPRGRLIAALIALTLLGAALYGRTASFGFTRSDDTTLIVEDAAFLQDIHNFPAVFKRIHFVQDSGSAYYRPMVTASYMLDAQWSGASPSGFHATNVVLHIVAAALLLLLLLRLGFNYVLALSGAAVFVVHPALTTAIAWIPGRNDSLLAIFALASTLTFLRCVESPRPAALVAHLLVLLLALFTKETAIVLPAVLVLYLLVVRPDRSSMLRRWSLWAGWGAVSLIWFSARNAAIVAREVAGTPTLVDRLQTALSSAPIALMHLGKIAFPYRLSVLAHSGDTPIVPGIVALLLAALVLWRWTRGNARRQFIWGAMLSAAFVVPTLAVSNFLILENRLYVPAIGVIIALLAAIAQADPRPRIVAIGSAVLVTVLFATSFRYASGFSSDTAFGEAAVKGSPNLGLAHAQLGFAHHRHDRIAEAEQKYRDAFRINPNEPVVHNNLGLIHLNRGQLREAEEALRYEIRVNPLYGKAHFNLGLVHQRRGKPAEAAAAFRRAAQLNPADAMARAAVGRP